MKYKKFLNNSKAISPIFATLILIAIAVIAGVVVYMFTSGTLATMTGGGTAAQEKISIQAVQGNSTSNIITVYATSTSGTVTISSAIIKDSSGNVVGAPVALTTGNTVTSAIGSGISVAFTTWTTGTNSYTVTLVSTQGGNFVSPSFTVTK